MLEELFGTPKPKKAPSAQNKPGTPAPAPRLDTVLGGNTHLQGNLKAEGNVRIDGMFIGDVTTQGRIAIGEQGKVEGDLIGEAVDVAGTVKGDIIAQRVGVARTGRVLGDLRLERLMTEEGGFIQGRVTMEQKVIIAEHLPKKAAEEVPPDDKEPIKEIKETRAAEPAKVKVAAGKNGK